MPGIIRLVPQKITVSSRIEKCLVARFFPFSHRKGDGAVREVFADLPDEIYQPVLGEGCILAALEHEGAETKGMPFLAAGEDGILVEAVAAGVPVAPSDAAVEAVISAVVGEFDKPPQIDVLAIISLLLLPRQ